MAKAPVITFLFQLFMGLPEFFFGLFLLIFIDMALRNTIGFSIEGAIEISEYILIAIGFLGLGYAQLKGGHVNVDILLLSLPIKVQRIVKICILLALVVFFITMGMQVGEETYVSWVNKEYRSGTTLLIPTWPPKFIAFAGTIVLVLSFLVQLSRIIDELIKDTNWSGRR